MTFVNQITSGGYVYTTSSALPAAERAKICNCVGPQNGEPKCPCMMRGDQKALDAKLDQIIKLIEDK